MTFLELCQKAARDSGTVNSLSSPTAVTGQTGRLGKVVYWVAEAWRRIQGEAGGQWRWLRADFSGALVAGTKRYAATALDASLTRVATWIGDSTSHRVMTIYETAVGVSDESELIQIPYETWKRMYDRGTQDQNRPVHWAVAPSNELVFGPVPDKGYTVRGEYLKSAQALAANDDTPECPAKYHDLIAWWAVQLLDGHDEADYHLKFAMLQTNALYAQMCVTELDQVEIGGGPLA